MPWDVQSIKNDYQLYLLNESQLTRDNTLILNRNKSISLSPALLPPTLNLLKQEVYYGEADVFSTRGDPDYAWSLG